MLTHVGSRSFTLFARLCISPGATAPANGPDDSRRRTLTFSIVIAMNLLRAMIVRPGMTLTPLTPAPSAPTDTTETSSTGSSGTTRRQALIAAGIGAGALSLAACGSSSGSSTSSSSSSSSAAAPASSAPAGSSGGATLAKLSDVPVGGAVSASDANGKPIIVSQPTAGKAVAFSAVCTHKQCTVKPAGKELHCPCHGSKFDALTGAVINGPAGSPLPPVSVTVKDGQVVPA